MCATKCLIAPDCGWSADAKTNGVRWAHRSYKRNIDPDRGPGFWPIERNLRNANFQFRFEQKL